MTLKTVFLSVLAVAAVSLPAAAMAHDFGYRHDDGRHFGERREAYRPVAYGWRDHRRFGDWRFDHHRQSYRRF